MAGEQHVASELGRVLGDDWVLMRGYCNRRGEIDHLLLGPPGLVAIESKHLNATVHCDGDSWRFEKFDKYGNLVARGSLSDRGGRSPSVQLNEPADLLEQFLQHPRRHRCRSCACSCSPIQARGAAGAGIRACTSRPRRWRWRDS